MLEFLSVLLYYYCLIARVLHESFDIDSRQ